MANAPFYNNAAGVLQEALGRIIVLGDGTIVTTGNPLPVSISGAIAVSTDATATAAAPTYLEGSTDALSMDLAGNLRTQDVPTQAPVAPAPATATKARLMAGTATSSSTGIAATNAQQGSLIMDLTSRLMVNTADTGAADAVISTASVSSAAVGVTFSTAGYGSVSFQISANAGANTVRMEGSNDNGATWDNIAIRSVGNSASNAATVAGTAGVGTFITTVIMPLMRWRVSTFVSGTTTVSVGLKRLSIPIITDVNVGNTTLAVVGNVASGATDSGNPVKVGGKYNATLPTFVDGNRTDFQSDVNGNLRILSNGWGAVAVDGTSNTLIFSGNQSANSISNRGLFASTGWGFNSATWDRLRTAQGIDTTGIGVQAVNPVGIFNTTLPTLTTGQYGQFQLDTRGGLFTVIKDSTGSAGAAVVQATDAKSNATNGLLSVGFGSGFNGTTWDRLRTIQGADTTGIGVTAIGDYLLKSATYATATAVSPAASATDIFVISASPSKTVWITKIKVNGTQTTGGLVSVFLQKHSTLDTGGTSSAPLIVPLSAVNPAATAVVAKYTANPTVGTVVGNVRLDSVLINGAAGTAPGGILWDFGTCGQPVVLVAGSTTELAVNLGGVSIAGGNFTISVEWIEF